MAQASLFDIPFDIFLKYYFNDENRIDAISSNARYQPVMVTLKYDVVYTVIYKLSYTENNNNIEIFYKVKTTDINKNSLTATEMTETYGIVLPEIPDDYTFIAEDDIQASIVDKVFYDYPVQRSKLYIDTGATNTPYKYYAKIQNNEFFNIILDESSNEFYLDYEYGNYLNDAYTAGPALKNYNNMGLYIDMSKEYDDPDVHCKYYLVTKNKLELGRVYILSEYKTEKIIENKHCFLDTYSNTEIAFNEDELPLSPAMKYFQYFHNYKENLNIRDITDKKIFAIENNNELDFYFYIKQTTNTTRIQYPAIVNNNVNSILRSKFINRTNLASKNKNITDVSIIDNATDSILSTIHILPSTTFTENSSALSNTSATTENSSTECSTVNTYIKQKILSTADAFDADAITDSSFIESLGALVTGLTNSLELSYNINLDYMSRFNIIKYAKDINILNYTDKYKNNYLFLYKNIYYILETSTVCQNRQSLFNIKIMQLSSFLVTYYQSIVDKYEQLFTNVDKASANNQMLLANNTISACDINSTKALIYDISSADANLIMTQLAAIKECTYENLQNAFAEASSFVSGEFTLNNHKVPSGTLQKLYDASFNKNIQNVINSPLTNIYNGSDITSISDLYLYIKGLSDISLRFNAKTPSENLGEKYFNDLTNTYYNGFLYSDDLYLSFIFTKNENEETTSSVMPMIDINNISIPINVRQNIIDRISNKNVLSRLFNYKKYEVTSKEIENELFNEKLNQALNSVTTTTEYAFNRNLEEDTGQIYENQSDIYNIKSAFIDFYTHFVYRDTFETSSYNINASQFFYNFYIDDYNKHFADKINDEKNIFIFPEINSNKAEIYKYTYCNNETINKNTFLTVLKVKNNKNY